MVVAGALFLVGSGVTAVLTDQGTATESIRVGEFGFEIEMSSTTPGAVVAPDKHSVTFTAPDITSSAPGTVPFTFAVTFHGVGPANIHVTQSNPGAPFTSLLVDPVADVQLDDGETHAYDAGLAWPELSNADLGRTLTITYTADATEADTSVDVVAPTATDEDLGTSGFITIPAVPHVDYFIDGAAAAAGNHDRTAGSYVVTAQAQPGYVLAGYPSGGWNLSIATYVPPPPVEFVGLGVGAQAGQTIALPAAAQPGDLAVVMITRNATALVPNLPSGYTGWAQTTGGSGTSQGTSRLCYRVLQAGDTQVASTQTWRAALVMVYRNATPGVALGQGGTSLTVTFPGLALQQDNGTSWVGGAAWSFNGMGVAAPPTGMVRRTTAGGIGGFDTNGGITSFASRTTPATSQPWNAFSFELKVTP
jgi:hypothetical protein